MTSVLLVLATSAGGVGRHVGELATGLNEADPGFDVLVCGPVRPPGGPGAFAFERVAISDRPRPLADAAAVRRLRSLLTGRDVVHAHGLRAGALAALAARSLSARRRPALVVTLHNALVSGGRIAVVHRMLERIVARYADVVLVVSADIGDQLRSRGARDVRLAIVPAPPLPPATRPAVQVRAELGVPDGAALLLTVARLAPQKGLDVLVAAVAALAAPGAGRDPGDATAARGVLAVIAGDGPLLGALTQDALTRDAPVRLLGHRDDVTDLIRAADVVVVPSLWEGQPLVVQEALRAGALLVATDSGGTAGLVLDAGVLVPPGDAAALASAIAGLLADPVRAEELRIRATARGQQLPGADDALRAISEVYAEVTRPA